MLIAFADFGFVGPKPWLLYFRTGIMFYKRSTWLPVGLLQLSEDSKPNLPIVKIPQPKSDEGATKNDGPEPVVPLPQTLVRIPVGEQSGPMVSYETKD